MTPTALLPLSAYAEDATGFWQRARWVTGVAFGIAAAFFMFLATWPRSGSLLVVLLTSVGQGAVAGVVFGVALTAWMRYSMRRVVARIHRLDPRIVPPIPAGNYSAYLPCNHFISERLAHGGILYVGPDGITFQPHRYLQTAATPGVHASVVGLSFSHITLPLTSWRRYLAPQPPEGLRVVWESGDTIFIVPRPAAVIQGIQAAILGHAA